MGAPGEPRMNRRRKPPTISASAKCAMISFTDHFSGGGRWRNLAVDTPLIRRSGFPPVAACHKAKNALRELLRCFLHSSSIADFGPPISARVQA